MSIGGVTGLPFQKNLLATQQLGTEQKNKLGIFESKQEESKALAQKIQSVSQTYAQKGTIFQTENYKTNVVENGYNGKLVDQKWAEANHSYEQTNVKRLNLTSQSLENAVIQTNINLKNYESKIKTTNSENTDLDKTISANSKEIEEMAKVFATEEQSKTAANYAKKNFDYSANKDEVLSRELTNLESSKGNSEGNLNNIKQKKSNLNASIGSLTSKKGNISKAKSNLSSKKSSLSADIDSIRDNIGNLKAKKGASKGNQVVQTGKGSVEAAPNTAIAIDANETVQQNNGAAAVIAETQNVATVETENSVETSEQVVGEESTQAAIDAEIDAQILGLEASLAAKIAEQDETDKDVEAQSNEEIQIDAEIASNKAELEKLAADEEKEITAISNLKEKISTKQKEINENKTVTKEKEDIYNKASEVHSADLAKKDAIEAKYKELVSTTTAMKEKRNNNDSGLKKLSSLKNYLSILLDGQGNAKAGTKANLEIAETKEAKAYDTLKIKNHSVEACKVGLFSQKDSEFRAKGDLNSVVVEMESYSNIFASITKA